VVAADTAAVVVAAATAAGAAAASASKPQPAFKQLNASEAAHHAASDALSLSRGMDMPLSGQWLAPDFSNAWSACALL
jgi:hypothetical protein